MKIAGKRVCLGIVVCLGCLYAYQFYQAQFRLNNIQFEGQAPQPGALFGSLQEFSDLAPLFAQEFTYLDRGKQSYVFLSADGRYVLKFFDAYGWETGSLLSFGHDLQLSQQKQAQLFEGYRLAYLKDREHSGVLLMRLAPDPQLSQQVAVRDRFGFVHQIALGSVPFVLQARAVPTRVEISALLRAGELEGAKARLGQIIELYLEGYRRGIYDDDHKFMYNTGFVEGKAMRIDSGRLREDYKFMQPALFLEDLRKVALERVDGWMGRHFPAYRQEIGAYMQAKLEGLDEARP
jgi:hypothetical protein